MTTCTGMCPCTRQSQPFTRPLNTSCERSLNQPALPSLWTKALTMLTWLQLCHFIKAVSTDLRLTATCVIGLAMQRVTLVLPVVPRGLG